MHRIAINLLVGLVIATLAAGPAVGGKTPSSTPEGVAAELKAKRGPKAVFSQPKHEFEPVVEGVKITHDFIIENQGDAPLVIKNIRPD